MEDNKNIQNTQSKKYFLTLNNPLSEKNGQFSHDKIKDTLVANFKSLEYFCMSDEIGLEQETPHTHVFIYFKNAVRYLQVQKYFPHADVQNAKGTCQQNYEYISKSGKWADDEKHGTSVEGTFEEWGEMPIEQQGARTDLTFLYDMIKDGYSNIEILEKNPDFMTNLTNIERVRQELKTDEYKNTFRILKTTYIYGTTGVGKTRYVMEKHGYVNVYRVTDYKHPFDGYVGQNVMLFDEFNGDLRIQDMNNYLDGYPLELPCRYVNKQACYEIAYLISNIKLQDLYKSVKNEYPEVWAAFMRRIHSVLEFDKDGTCKEYDTWNYAMGRKFEIIKTAEDIDRCFRKEETTTKKVIGEQVSMAGFDDKKSSREVC